MFTFGIEASEIILNRKGDEFCKDTLDSRAPFFAARHSSVRANVQNRVVFFFLLYLEVFVIVPFVIDVSTLFSRVLDCVQHAH